MGKFPDVDFIDLEMRAAGFGTSVADKEMRRMQEEMIRRARQRVDQLIMQHQVDPAVVINRVHDSAVIDKRIFENQPIPPEECKIVAAALLAGQSVDEAVDAVYECRARESLSELEMQRSMAEQKRQLQMHEVQEMLQRQKAEQLQQMYGGSRPWRPDMEPGKITMVSTPKRDDGFFSGLFNKRGK